MRTPRAFTLIELLVVISIIAILAGLVVGIAPAASSRMKEARVRTELAALVTSIEFYKGRYGVYPPDNYNATTRRTDSVLNPLYYELTGVLVDNEAQNFRTADENRVLTPEVLNNYFGREGIVNSAPRVGRTETEMRANDGRQKRRLYTRDFNQANYAEIFRSSNAPGYVDLELLAVGFGADASGKKNAGIPWPINIGDANAHPVRTNPGLNPWHYVSTNPTNNPNSFDLWAELPLKTENLGNGTWKVTVKVIGNWREESVVERIVPPFSP